MKTQTNYRNKTDGEQEIPLKEGLSFDQMDKLDKRKYRYRFYTHCLIAGVVLIILFFATPGVQQLSLGTGSGWGVVRMILKFLKTRSP